MDMDITRAGFGLHADPVDALLSREGDAVLAIIIGTEGPAYRPVGAMMTVFADQQRVGTLSSGCIETDIALQAVETLRSGQPMAVRYGRGSPFMDIKLPCGGGLDILLLPRPDRAVLAALAERRHRREPVTLRIMRADGALSLHDEGETGGDATQFQLRMIPDIRFLVCGKGPEAGTFSALVQSAGYPNMLLSPDDETLAHARALGCETRHLSAQKFPSDLAIDARTAIVLFFHDHDWEPPILSGVLDSPAFYIGAQGSKVARDGRNLQLEAMGFSRDALARLRGPIGLLPSARDARTLAISVLAEVLEVAGEVAAT